MRLAVEVMLIAGKRRLRIPPLPLLVWVCCDLVALVIIGGLLWRLSA